MLLTSAKHVLNSNIKTLLNNLEKLIDINPSNTTSITKSDLLEEGLDYKSVYGKISSLIKDSNNNIVSNDRFSKLKFEPESLRSEFYRIVKDLNLTNYKVTSRTKINHLMKKLRYKIIN